jgi:uroporphyrinogen III methyltransferase/synthase
MSDPQFEPRPLFGQKILVTRPLDQSADLVDRLAALGAAVLIQPAIRISEPPEWAAVDEVLARLGSFDWLVFSSANGVRYLLDRLWFTGGDLRRLGGVRLAAIGPGTAEALAQYHLRTDLTPEKFRAEALAEALAAEAAGQRFLLARASRGREVLAEQLRAAGGHVEQVVVYSSTDVQVADEALSAQLVGGEIAWITVTSSAIAKALHGLFGEHLRRSRLASISPLTSAALRQLGYEPDAEATEYTLPGIVEAILRASGRASP